MSMPARRSTTVHGRRLVLLGALAIDLAVGERRSRWHPVAVLGRLLDALISPARPRGALEQLAAGAAVLALPGLALGGACAAAENALRRRHWFAAATLAVLLKPTFSIRQLLEEALAVADALEADDLAAARHRLRALVSRSTEQLTGRLAASAAIESVAENLADSVAAPLLFYSVFGLPGAALYRLVNTADAMFGYRGEMEWLGKPAARADDLLSWLPSRLSAAAIVAAASLLGGLPAGRSAAGTWARDGSATSSPNAGRPMSAMAGAVKRRLEKPAHHVLGAEYPEPTAEDVRRAVRTAGLAAVLLCVAALAGCRPT